jgi:formylglycine-generating enzyme required for sulfatase activity
MSGDITEIIDERVRILRDFDEAKNKAAQLQKHTSKIAQYITETEVSDQLRAQLAEEGTAPSELAKALNLLEAEFEKIDEARSGINTYEGQIQREKEKRRNLSIGAGGVAIIAIVSLIIWFFNQQDLVSSKQTANVSPNSSNQQVASNGIETASETGADTPTRTKTATKVVTRKPARTFTTTPTSSRAVAIQNATSTNTPTSVPTYTAPPSVSPEDISNTTDMPSAASSVSKPTLDWVYIPADDFVMGSSNSDLEQTLIECNETEGKATGQLCQIGWFHEPQRAVFVDEFEITKYEITNSQYEACVAAGVCNKANIKIENNLPVYDEGYFSSNYPVVRVSWNDANAFCQWINGRLPTEEEWEKAARGTDGRRYPWGNTFASSMANLGSTYPAPVGSFSEGASPYGVMDMAGNAFEWTATWGERGYLVRGGSWNNYFFRGRVTDRGTQLDPSFANYDIGFRCARSG